MTQTTAYQIVSQYEAYVKVNGIDWTERHFLAKGRDKKRYETNRRLLDEARQVLQGGRRREGK